MRKSLPFLMLLLSLGGFAQKSNSKAQAGKAGSGVDTIKVAQKAPILLLDEVDVDFANKVPLENFLSDSLIFNLSDDAGSQNGFHLATGTFKSEPFPSAQYA